MLLVGACAQSEGEEPVMTHTIGGIVIGAAGSGLVLHNNSADGLEIHGNGPFTFAMELEDGSAYRVTVARHPTLPVQTCDVSRGEGILAGADVTDVEITCTTESFRIGGTVSGLEGTGLQLQNNGGDDMAITEDGPFAFPTALSDGMPYEVTVQVQPTSLSQTCTVLRGVGTLQGEDASDVAIECATDVFTIGGTVEGLVGSGLVLQNNGEDDLPVSQDGFFTFPAALTDGSAYDVGISIQPVEPDHACQVSGGAGIVEGADVTGIEVYCGWVEILEFSSSRTLVSAGDDVRLIWATRDATQCEIEPAGIATDPVASGSAYVTIDGRTSFSLNCQGPGGPVSRSLVVEVTDEDWTGVSAGTAHTCGLKADGRLFCWGAGSYGKLGDGEVTTSHEPVQVSSTEDEWAQVSAGDAHTCALKVDGRLYCWGFGSSGQVGDGEATLVNPSPVQEATAAGDWRQVSAGYVHTCGVKTDGRLFCWGAGGSGQLGHDDTAPSAVPVQEATEASDWAQVSAGFLHTCAVKTDGRLFCWGAGGGGQLGNDDTENSLVPVQEDSRSENWQQVSAGYGYTCAVKLDGRLFCWGGGTRGRLGSGSTTMSTTPTQEATAAGDWSTVSAGQYHTCALNTDGHLYCWGDGSSGALGDEVYEQRAVPVATVMEPAVWAQASVGVQHSCALTEGGRIFCWGFHGQGRLGNGTHGRRPEPTQERTEAGDWEMVSAGSDHACSVKADGRLYCWGQGSHGRLGNVAMVRSRVAVQEAGAADDWVQVSAGAAHTCAVKRDGRLFCWGRGNVGQIGNGEYILDNPVPVQEATAAVDWHQVSGGGAHTCAVKVDGRLFCWGHGASGQIGHGETSSSPEPIQEETGADDWAQVSTGTAHTCAVKRDGRLFCWGAGGHGRLGNDEVVDSPVPVQEASAADDWAKVSAGNTHTCGLKVDGRLFCWGNGADGRLGEGRILNRRVPMEVVSPFGDWTQVSAGGNHTCAVRGAGWLFCWGDGGSGQLGQEDVSAALVPLMEGREEGTWGRVSAGGAHSCAVKNDGRLFCWGSDASGQLALGTPPGPVRPVE